VGDPNKPVAVAPAVPNAAESKINPSGNQPTGNAGEAPDDEVDYITADELLSDTPTMPQTKLKTKWGELTPEELIQKVEEAESKRAGFQSEADALRARLQAEAAVSASRQTPSEQPIQTKQPELLKAPVLKEYMKKAGDDEDSRVEALTTYYEDKSAYDKQQMEIAVERKMQTVRETERVNAQAERLAKADPRFRNGDGTPNIPAITAYLNGVTSDWSTLYQDQVDAEKYRELIKSGASAVGTAAAPRVEPAKSDIHNLSTVASTGGAGVPPRQSGTKVPQDILELKNRYGSQFTLPPGARIVKS
jgi:hypothetical protein